MISPPDHLLRTPAELQHALSEAPVGATLRLAAGHWPGPWLVSRSYTLVGPDAGEPGVALLDGRGRGPCLELEGEGTALRLVGLSLTGGLGDRGGAVRLHGELRLELVRCLLSGNRARHAGGALAASRGWILLQRCRLLDNEAELGGALALEGAARAVLRDTLVTGNRAQRGGGLALGGDARLEGRYLTVAGNQAARGEALWLDPGEVRLVLASSLLAGAASGPGPVVAAAAARSGEQPFVSSASVLPVELAATGRVERRGGVLFDTPRFAGHGAEPWRLQPDSPGRRLGRGEDAGPGGLDLVGEPRLWHDLPDAGAFSRPAGQEVQPPMKQVRPESPPDPAAPTTPAAAQAGPARPAAAAGAVPYAGAAEQLDDLLLPVPLLLQRYLGRHWFRAARTSGQLSDLFVSLEEVYLRLAGRWQGQRPPVPPLLDLPGEVELDAALTEVRTAAAARHAATRMAGRRLPLTVLDEALQLGEVSRSLLLAAVALQLDLSLYRVAAFAWGDPNARQPTVGFLLDLVCADPAARQQALAELAPGRLLRRFGVLELGEVEGWAPHTPELFRTVTVPDRVVRYLRGESGLDEELPAGAAALLTPPAPLPALVLSPPTRSELARAGLAGELRGWGDAAGVLVLHAATPGCGRATLATALAAAAGRPAWVIDAARLADDEGTLAAQLRAALREALLLDALPVLRLDLLPVTVSGAEGRVRQLCAAWGGFFRRAAIVCRDALRPAVVAELPDARLLPVARPDRPTQAALWSHLLAARGWSLAPGEAEQVTGAYDLAPSELVRAVSLLQSEAAVGVDGRVPADGLLAAVRAGIRHQLTDLAERVTTTLTWADAILPEDIRRTLAEVVAYARHRDRVFGSWGFARKAGGHFGLSVLFSGPPGTGKTMTAALVAGDLGRELYRIDLSRVVDKYIGETEKNLARLFDQAEKAQVILLFDEADSLFSSRTAVKSSNDRYANLEVNYLLQRMEAYSGVSILTTNFDMGLDAAFQRRLRFRIGFRMPDIAERERLWRSMMPPEARQEAEIEWHVLAEEFEMAGGNIKNAIIRAAMMAAEQDCAIGFDQVYDAALAEFREMGRLA